MSSSVDNALLDFDQAKSQEVLSNMFGYFSNKTFFNVGACVCYDSECNSSSVMVIVIVGWVEGKHQY
jgi:acetolactate synthase small subunit